MFTSTQPILFVPRHTSSTTYDHRSHSQQPKTSIDTPNTIICFRICFKWVFGMPPNILKHLIESLYQLNLFYLCLGIVNQSLMMTAATHTNLGQAQLHPTQLSLSDSAASWYLGSFKKQLNILYEVVVVTGYFIYVHAQYFNHI